jgi:hypothetical protein
LGLFLFAAALIWLFQFISDGKVNQDIEKAWKAKDYQAYYRLSAEKSRREVSRRQAEAHEHEGTLWMDRILVLDAAEHGVFAPGAEQVFEDPGEFSSGYHASDEMDVDFDDYDGDDYQDEYQQYERYDEEQWYPGNEYLPG